MKIFCNQKSKSLIIPLVLFVATLFMSIGYASINSVIVNINGSMNANVQDGVFITDAVYMSNVNADYNNSAIDSMYQTTLRSHVTLSSSDINSTITYNVTLYNNSAKDYIFIDTLTDKSDSAIYSNDNIGFVVDGLEEYITVISAGEKLNFSLSFKYETNADVSKNTLSSILNFRFKEVPKLNLSNENELYTLTDIYPNYMSQKYEFIVSNYDQTETNGVPMTYYFETVIDEPLVAKIYDADGNEVTGSIEISGDNNEYVEHLYTLEIIWDDSNSTDILYNSYEYADKAFDCSVLLKAKPIDEEYLEYAIMKKFDVDITSADFNFNVTVNQSIGAEKVTTNLPIIVNNYNSTAEYNNYAVEYNLSFTDNDKFTPAIDNVGLVDGFFIRTLDGNSKIDDSFNLSLMADIYALSTTETATLTITTKAPYVKEISFPITITLQPLVVRFDANGGTVDTTNLTTYKGRTYGTLPTPTRIGHTFDGWYTTAEGGTQITSESEATIGNAVQTLYARWTSRLLSDYVEPGQLVNYDVDYSNVSVLFKSETLNVASGYTGWKVLDVVGTGDDKYVTLISAGIPLTFWCPYTTSDTTNGSSCELALTDNFFSTSITSTLTKYKFYRNGFTNVSTIGGLQTAFKNSQYTKLDSSGKPIVRSVTKSDIDGSLATTAKINNTTPVVIANLTDFRENKLFGITSTSSSYGYVPYYIATKYETYYLWASYLSGYVVYTNSSYEHGVRPVVALKATTETTGQLNGIWQLSAVSE